MFSLPLEPHLTVRRTNWQLEEAAELNVTSRVPWRHALAVDTLDPAKSLRFEQRELAPGQAPFNQSGGWPCVVRASVRQLPETALYLGEGEAGSIRTIRTAATTENQYVEERAADAHGHQRRQLPSPACSGPSGLTCGPPQSVLLVPHGATILRIGMMPIA